MEADQVFSFAVLGPAHAVYFGTYELVKDLAGGNVDEGHHPLAAGELSRTIQQSLQRRDMNADPYSSEWLCGHHCQ